MGFVFYGLAVIVLAVIAAFFISMIWMFLVFVFACMFLAWICGASLSTKINGQTRVYRWFRRIK